MKNSLYLAIALCSSVSALSACSDPTSASESNYKLAIQKYFDSRDDFPHCFFNYTFPAEFKGKQLKFSGVESKLRLLHELGLLEYRSKTLGEDYGNPVTYYGFNISEQGKAFFNEEQGFCIGKPKLLELKDISEPYEERGKTYVRGTYTWTVELPKWAMNEKFYKSKEFSTKLWYIKYNKLEKDEVREEYFTLTKNDDGWGF